MNPIYHQATFIKSSPTLTVAPKDEGKEIAFAGRSNAGKSSALNAITRQSSLARTSKTPGRTQMLNFFSITEQLRFVDLPGYGYAQVPADVQRKWQKSMEQYLNQRQSLCALVLVMDIRHPLTPFDTQLISWCEHAQLPLHILLTKADKLTYGASKNTLLQVTKTLSTSTSPVSLQLFSSSKKTGIDDAHVALDRLFGLTAETGQGLEPV